MTTGEEAQKKTGEYQMLFYKKGSLLLIPQ